MALAFVLPFSVPNYHFPIIVQGKTNHIISGGTLDTSTSNLYVEAALLLPFDLLCVLALHCC
jgi:hypothetical protein